MAHADFERCEAGIRDDDEEERRRCAGSGSTDAEVRPVGSGSQNDASDSKLGRATDTGGERRAANFFARPCNEFERHSDVVTELAIWAEVTDPQLDIFAKGESDRVPWRVEDFERRLRCPSVRSSVISGASGCDDENVEAAEQNGRAAHWPHHTAAVQRFAALRGEMAEFTHLHLHTQYSLLDGAIRVKDLFPRLIEMGMDTVAVTDHGNMFGAIDLYTAAKKHGVKLIFGCETYVSAAGRTDRTNRRSYHLILLAKNEVGYRNLSYLNSMGYLEGFYYNPRIDKQILGAHSEGPDRVVRLPSAARSRKRYSNRASPRRRRSLSNTRASLRRATSISSSCRTSCPSRSS